MSAESREEEEEEGERKRLTVTEVVPSPAAASCERASSTSILAAGCVTVILFRMVAPSLVMTTSPLGWQTW